MLLETYHDGRGNSGSTRTQKEGGRERVWVEGGGDIDREYDDAQILTWIQREYLGGTTREARDYA